MKEKTYETQIIIPEEELDFGKLLGVVFRNWKLILGFAAFFGVLAYGYSDFILPLRYQASAVLIPSKNSDSSLPASLSSAFGSYGLGGLVSATNGADELARYELILRSRALVSEVIEQENLLPRFQKIDPDRFVKKDPEVAKEALIVKLRGGLVLEKVNPALVISMETVDPQLSADVVAAFVKYLHNFIQKNTITRSKATELFVEQRLGEAKETLEEIQAKYVALQESKGVVQLTSQSNITLNQAAELRSQIIHKDMEIELYRDILKDTGEILRLEAERNQLQAQLDRLVSGQNNTRSQKGKASKGVEVFTPLDKLPLLEMGFASVERDYLMQAKLVELLQQQYEVARIGTKKDEPTFDVIDPPVVPMFPSGPNVKLYTAVGILFGIFVSVISVLLLNQFSERRLPKHIRRFVVIVPREEGSSRSKRTAES